MVLTKINKIVLHGFKSFAKRTEFVFGDNFNVVLGPNGSGKSNVLDAICFVLGRVSAKSLRAEKSSSLIYNGGKEKKPSDKAEVSITFDNTSKIFPIDTPEIKITRIVRKDGASLYRINDKRMTRQQIIDLLSAARIDTEGYNIILQGDIIKLIEMSSIERRLIMEEISGISIYEDKKQKALSELEKVDSQIKDAEIILTERETYLKELKKDHDQALKYKNMKDMIDRYRATVLNSAITEKRGEVDTFDKGKKDQESTLKKFQDDIDRLRQAIDEKKRKMEDITREIEDKGEKDQVAIMKEIEQLKVANATNAIRLENIKNQLLNIKDRREQLKNEAREADTKSSGLKKRIKELEQKKAQIEKEQKQIEDAITQFKKKNDLGDIPQIEQEIQAIDKETEKQQETIQKFRESQQNLFREKDKIEFQLKSIEEGMEKLKEVEKEHEQEVKNLKSKRDYFKNITLELNKCLAEDSSIAAQLAKNREELTRKREELSKLQAISVGIAENISADFAIKRIIEQKKKMPGIYGTVAELGKVQSKFSLALEIAAGPRINNIVVQDDKVAADCIKYLKENKLGTATFLPVNKIRSISVTPETKELLKVKGVQGVAVDLVEFDTKFRNIFQYIFGNTIVVDNIDVARRIGIGIARMVTIEGDLAEISGAMSGGYRKRTKGVGFQQKETSDNISELETKVAELENLVSVLEKRRKENEQRIGELRTNKASTEGEILKIEKSLHLEEGDVDASKKQKDQLRDQLKDCDAKLATITGEISEANKEFAKIKIKKEELRSKINKLQNPRLLAELNTFEEKKKELNNDSISTDHEIKTLEMQIRDMIGPELEKISKILKQLDKEEEQFRSDLEKTEAKIIADSASLKEKEKKQKEFYAKYKELFSERDKVNKEAQNLEGDKIRKEEQSRQVEIKINNFSLKNAGLVAELAGQEKEYERYQGLELIRDKSDQALKSEITRFENMVQEMGNINLKALEVYDAAEGEYNKLLKKKDMLTKEKDDVIKLMDEIEGRKGELFMKTFDKVNENFQVIFDQLTGKGKAYLLLENPEKPFEGGVRIMVRISGQRFMDIRSLSGGEKSLTALAFIFAIQENEPASFYVLDEVDAALDKHNSEKLAKLIRKYSEKAQYVVISHNDAIISEADLLYGVSMDEHSISNAVSLKV